MAIQDTEKTKVIFRFWRGDIIAIFPEMPGTPDVGTCSSYQHMGQHSACDPYGIIGESRPAKTEEYKKLKTELERHCGYNLKVISRNRYHFLSVRRQEINNRKH